MPLHVIEQMLCKAGLCFHLPAIALALAAEWFTWLALTMVMASMLGLASMLR
jgi:hypothetical protein